ncbi:MAG: hypothetical protein IPM54_35065 [Polyangiaceae bacterium]|nr:hypothetical protein [Polyangiaceae bacterium]
MAKVDTKRCGQPVGMWRSFRPCVFITTAETFALPVRLGLVNSGGTRD